MDTLILSVSAGGGHGHAAEAIKSYIKIHEPYSRIRVIDTIKYINPILDKVIIGSYLKTIKITPQLFGKLYNFAETDDGIATLSSKVNSLLTSKLLPLIKDFKPQIIITTHPFTTEMLSILKQKGDLDTPVVCVMTDYAPHAFWIHKKIDRYIVSNSDMIDEMVQRGVKKDIIFDLGIPTKPEFIGTFDKSSTIKELGFNEDIPVLLVMGGSLGMGKIANIYSELIKIETPCQIIVITGNNKKLYSDLKKLEESSNKNTVILGYTENVNKYMQCADLLLTKPGGLTITEALICRVPLAIFSPIPGQEEKNVEFLLRHNLAIDLGSGKNCSKIIEELLASKGKLEKMKENCEKFSKPKSGNDIYNLLKSIIK